MTAPPDPERLRASARWCAGLAEALADVAGQAGRLAEHIAADRPDERGREWAERLHLLRHDLGRSAADAVELGEAYTRQVADAALWGISAGAAGRQRGMRLGGTDGSRADVDRGVDIAELPPFHGQAPS